MAKSPLVGEYRAAGKALLAQLHDDDFVVTRAFWMYSDEAEEWFLFLATSDYETVNLTELYGHIRQALHKVESPIDQHQIRLLSSRSEPAISLPARGPFSITGKGPDDPFEWPAPLANVSATGVESDTVVIYATSHPPQSTEEDAEGDGEES